MDFKNTLVFDIEVLPNHVLVMFKHVTKGKVLKFEMYNDSKMDRKNIAHLCQKYQVVSFNGNGYDTIIIEAIISGFNNRMIYEVSKHIITKDDFGKSPMPWITRKHFDIPQMEFPDHIDLMNVPPKQASLKIYAARLHARTLVDSVVDFDKNVNKDQIKLLRHYCNNDLDETELLLRRLEKELDLRVTMSNQYKVNLISKSDAQIAEAVFKSELSTKYNIDIKRPEIPLSSKFLYKPPSYLEFQTDTMKEVFNMFCTKEFSLKKNGDIKAHDDFKKYKFKLGYSTYKVGSGGLHSCEKNTCHIADGYKLKDFDVTSYYPRIILNNRLFPKHIGKNFLRIYNKVVETRIAAKNTGKKAIANSLKIVINGSFGKFGSKWSSIYSPRLLMQTTVTGQLSLLMLIEMLHLQGVETLSANTDGVVIKMEYHEEELVDDIIREWELITNFNMESTEYSGLYSRSVNSYIAVKPCGEAKGKGDFVDSRDSNGVFNLDNNPSNEICSEAVKKFLSKNVPIEQTILGCDDITKFVTVRQVAGGAVKHDTPIGKAIRWYYGKHELDAIYYKTNGNKVARSDFGVPIMEYPDKIPDDIDFQWYIDEANTMLKNVGYYN